MKISTTAISQYPYYFHNGDYFLCCDFIRKMLGEIPNEIKITVSDYRMHRCKRFKFVNRDHVYTKSFHSISDTDDDNGNAFVLNEAKRVLRQAMPNYVGKTLYFHVEDMKPIVKGSIVKYKDGWYRVSALFSKTVNLSGVFATNHIYHKGVSLGQVVEDEDAWRLCFV